MNPIDKYYQENFLEARKDEPRRKFQKGDLVLHREFGRGPVVRKESSIGTVRISLDSGNITVQAGDLVLVPDVVLRLETLVSDLHPAIEDRRGDYAIDMSDEDLETYRIYLERGRLDFVHPENRIIFRGFDEMGIRRVTYQTQVLLRHLMPPG